jgi:hypothetical protein
MDEVGIGGTEIGKPPGTDGVVIGRDTETDGTDGIGMGSLVGTDGSASVGTTGFNGRGRRF